MTKDATAAVIHEPDGDFVFETVALDDVRKDEYNSLLRPRRMRRPLKIPSPGKPLNRF